VVDRALVGPDETIGGFFHPGDLAQADGFATATKPNQYQKLLSLVSFAVLSLPTARRSFDAEQLIDGTGLIRFIERRAKQLV
jgi:hypothetical protein